MSHSAEQTTEFRRQSYWRLLAYVRPYWKQLVVGILAGMLVGSSLFVTLTMIPQMIGLVDATTQQSERDHRQKALQLVRSFDSTAAKSEEERVKIAEKLLFPTPEGDPQLMKMVHQADAFARRFHLPIHVEGHFVRITWPKEYRFEIITAKGQVAWQLFALYVAGFLLLWLLKNCANYVNAYCTRWVGSRVVADLRDEIFSKLTDQSLKFYGNIDIGQLISRCQNDTAALEYAVSHCVEELTNAPLQLLGCLAAVVVACRQYDNYLLLGILAFGFPLLIAPLQFLGRAIRKRCKKTYGKIADVITRMHEVFMGIRVVKAYHTENYENEKFHQVNYKYFKQVIRAMRLQIIIAPVMEVIVISAVMVFLVYSFAKGVSVTQLSALLAPALMAYRPIKDISKVLAMLQQSMAAADRFFNLIDIDTSLPEKSDAADIRKFHQEIELRDVSFSYDDQKIIDHVSFKIPRGSVVAVVGETGSGKTTIANLIARFYDVTDGAILIDGIDVRDYKIDSLRKLIGVVNQDPILFNDTIAANISYGSPNATQADIEKAALLANAHGFITGGAHAEGYDTVVGENGFKLSGGEKQRVAIARAILRNPPILILDEATSALDNVTEKLVQEALNRVMNNRTVFAIAHRLSTIQNADLIIVLQHGRIIESGTHQQLLAFNGIYRRLHDTQFE